MLPKVRTKTHREETFCHDAPHLWISRPEDVRVPLNTDRTQAAPSQFGFWLIFIFGDFIVSVIVICLFQFSFDPSFLTMFSHFLFLIFIIYHTHIIAFTILFLTIDSFAFILLLDHRLFIVFFPYSVISFTTFHSCFFVPLFYMLSYLFLKWTTV